MNQDNWEKAKSDFIVKYITDRDEKTAIFATVTLTAGADFGRAYSQGEYDDLLSRTIARNADVDLRSDQLSQENAELKYAIDELNRHADTHLGKLRLENAELTAQYIGLSLDYDSMYENYTNLLNKGAK